MKNSVDGKVMDIDGEAMMKDHVAPPNPDQRDARLGPLSKVKSTFCQPLGGWQFMSANQLRNPQGDGTLVEDEIESFFYLLLFCALRYLPHNCRNVPAFMEEYFDGRTRYNEEDFGGYAKWIAMNSGHIHLFNSVAGPLTFYLPSELNNKPGSSSPDPSMAGTLSNRDVLSSTSGATAPSDTFHCTPHPINVLFSSLLQSFHAHYTLIKEQNKPSSRLVAAPIPVPVVEEADEAPTEEEIWFIDAYKVDFKEPVSKKGTVYSERTVVEGLAANIKRHEDVLSLFRRVVGSASKMPDSNIGPWPRNDKGPDQLTCSRDCFPDEARDPVEPGGEY